MQNNTTR